MKVWVLTAVDYDFHEVLCAFKSKEATIEYIRANFTDPKPDDDNEWWGVKRFPSGKYGTAETLCIEEVEVKE